MRLLCLALLLDMCGSGSVAMDDSIFVRPRGQDGTCQSLPCSGSISLAIHTYIYSILSKLYKRMYLRTYVV